MNELQNNLHQKAGILWLPHWHLYDYKSDEDAYIAQHVVKNPFYKCIKHLDLGKNIVLNQAYNALHLLLENGTQTELGLVAELGVGISNAAELATHTGLQGGTTFWQVVDGAPTISGANNETRTYITTFGTAVANFDWQELGIRTGTGGTQIVIARLIQDMGVKTSAISRALNVAITLAEAP